MSNREDYESKLASAVAIPGDQIVNPGNIPMEIYVQEAETLFQFCQKDKDALLGKGLDENYITDLPIRCGALREAESQWLDRIQYFRS